MNYGDMLNIGFFVLSAIAVVISFVTLVLQIGGYARKKEEQKELRQQNSETRLTIVEGQIKAIEKTFTQMLKSMSSDIQFIKEKLF